MPHDRRQLAILRGGAPESLLSRALTQLHFAGGRKQGDLGVCVEFFGGGGVYMREIGTMLQIGVLTGNRALFWSKMGHFRHFRSIRTRREFRGVTTWNCTFLYLPGHLQKDPFTRIYSINRGSDWVWLETQQTS